MTGIEPVVLLTQAGRSSFIVSSRVNTKADIVNLKDDTHHQQHQATLTNHTSLSSASSSTTTTNSLPSPPQCLVFLHIPKVGGRTVTRFLSKLARMRRIRRNYDVYNADIERLIPEKMQPNRTFTKGHFTTRLFVLNPDFLRCYKLTVLREPIDRAVSAFFYHKHKLDDVDTCLVDGSDHTDDTERRCKYDDRRQYSNGIVRQLAGLHPENSNGFVDTSRRPANRTHLEHAKQNLDKYFDTVCFLDDNLPVCMERVMKHFHMTPIEEKYLNVTSLRLNKDNQYRTKSRPHNIDDMTVEKFQQANKLDIELYNFAKSRYNY